MKHKLLFFMAFFLPYLAFAQGNVNVKGSVIGAVSNDPVPGVIVTVKGQTVKLEPTRMETLPSGTSSRENTSFSLTP